MSQIEINDMKSERNRVLYIFHQPQVQEVLLRMWKVICSEFGGSIGEQEYKMLLFRLKQGKVPI